MGEGVDKAIRQVRALEFLNDVGQSGDILEFVWKVREEGYLRVALISHLKNLFTLSEEECEEVIEKFIGK